LAIVPSHFQRFADGGIFLVDVYREKVAEEFLEHWK
jgi:hypothetical protein